MSQTLNLLLLVRVHLIPVECSSICKHRPLGNLYKLHEVKLQGGEVGFCNLQVVPPGNLPLFSRVGPVQKRIPFRLPPSSL
ncbi:hypothetical protein V8F20_008646, partial [Naviculisporaceae sp. PSN 640]